MPSTAPRHHVTPIVTCLSSNGCPMVRGKAKLTLVPALAPLAPVAVKIAA